MTYTEKNLLAFLVWVSVTFPLAVILDNAFPQSFAIGGVLAGVAALIMVTLSFYYPTDSVEMVADWVLIGLLILAGLLLFPSFPLLAAPFWFWAVGVCALLQGRVWAVLATLTMTAIHARSYEVLLGLGVVFAIVLTVWFLLLPYIDDIREVPVAQE
jgi:hypothetical protein